MSLLRPGVIKQHKPNQTYNFTCAFLECSLYTGLILADVLSSFTDLFMCVFQRIQMFPVSQIKSAIVSFKCSKLVQ